MQGIENKKYKNRGGGEMAGLGEIVIKTSQYRPCIVKGKKQSFIDGKKNRKTIKLH